MRTATNNKTSTVEFQRTNGRIPVQTTSRIPPRTALFAADIDNPESIILVCLIVVLITGAFLISSSQFYHWFLIPVMICGVLTGTDALAWIRGRIDLYDLIGILGLFGFHFFFLAPLLHVEWDMWIDQVSPPPDWRDWLGYMGCINVIGLIAFRVCRNMFKASAVAKGPKTFWQIDKELFGIVTPSCLAIAAALQIWIYARMGGISGYMQAMQTDPTALEGMGWVLMVSESVGAIAMFLLIVHFQNGKMGWSKTLWALFVLFAVQFIFAGLRGSRSQMVQFLFWVVGCIHFLVRPVPRKLVFAGSIFVMVFLYFYAFYKAGGAGAVSQAFSGSAAREQVSQKTGRTFGAIVLGDLGRADVQAFVLYRLVHNRTDFEYAFGRTYLSSVLLPVPHFLVPVRPETKLKWGTDIQSGTGHYVPKVAFSSRVYGLAGEAMLNFGPVAVPFMYALFGLLVGWMRVNIARLLPGDTRFLVIPLVIYTYFAALIGDSDNWIFGLIKDGFVPFFIVFVCSVRRRVFVPQPAQQHIPVSRPSLVGSGYARQMSPTRDTWNRR